jgi:hypothetical protein
MFASVSAIKFKNEQELGLGQESSGPLGPGRQHTQMFPSPQTEGHPYPPPLTIQSLPPAIITFHVRRKKICKRKI